MVFQGIILLILAMGCKAQDMEFATMSASLQRATCKGAFDVYFVLDKSSSLYKDGVNHFKNDTVSFVAALCDKFTSPLLRLSFITFSTKAHIDMPLTQDRSTVEAKLNELREIYPQGDTRMELGLKLAIEQIKNAEKRASVIIALTDGKLSYTTKKQSIIEADMARKLGAAVFTVGVSNYNKAQLLAIAGKTQFLFEAADFSGLNRIVKEVVDGSCVEVLWADPSIVCTNESFTLTVGGRGFNKTGDMSHVRCNFHMDNKPVTLVVPTETSDTRLICPSPENFVLRNADLITLQISMNDGISFVSSNVTITSYRCNGATVGLFVALILLLVLAIAALWWFWNAICCVVTVAPVVEKKKPPPPTPAPPIIAPVTETRQWPAVNASFYGVRGAGGIKPVAVKWGDKGCTEAALHLERTKDAEEVAVVAREVVVEREIVPPPVVSLPPKPVTCFGRFKKFLSRLFSPVISLFQRLSIRRPNRDDVGNCVLVKRNQPTNTPTSNNNSYEKQTPKNVAMRQVSPLPPRGSYLDTNS